MKNSTINKILLATSTMMFAISTPVWAADMDDKIESAFKETYVYKTYLSDDDIKAHSKDGVVTLSGVVDDVSQKTLAEETVANLPGVNRVDNKLETKKDVATDNADTWIGRKIKLTLMFHRNVSIKTNVEVKDGVVTLTGEAVSLAQKELTQEYAADIDGVKEVKNEMTVVAEPTPQTVGEKIDDASVTAHVKTALLMHRSTSAVKTKVVTMDGVVTLTGVAKNDAEKSLISKLTSDIQGVVKVKNEMTLEK